MRAGDEAAQDGLPVTVRDIERDAAFVPVKSPPEQRALQVRLGTIKWSKTARWGATWRFDRDDVGTQVTKNLTAEHAALSGEIKDTIGAEHSVPLFLPYE